MQLRKPYKSCKNIEVEERCTRQPLTIGRRRRNKIHNLSLYLYSSIQPSTVLSIYSSLYLPIQKSINILLNHSFHQSIQLIYPATRIYSFLTAFLILSFLSETLFILLSIFLSIYQYIYLSDSVSLSTFPSIHLFQKKQENEEEMKINR